MASEPKDNIRIDNIKLLKVISDPTRKKIIDVLYDKPLTASEIADKISYPKDKIYYHIKKLQTNGILIIAESEKVKGITQNKFINAAKKFEIEKTLIGEETPKSSKTEDKEDVDEKAIDEVTEGDSEEIEKENDAPTPEGNPLLALEMQAVDSLQGLAHHFLFQSLHYHLQLLHLFPFHQHLPYLRFLRIGEPLPQ